jgi:hypothetical protein
LNDIAKEKLKTDTDYEKMAEIDWYGSLWVEDGRLVILGEAIEAVIVRAAQTPKTGRADLAGLICPENAKLIYKGSTCLNERWVYPEFHLRIPVRVNMSRTIRTRPIIRTGQRTLTYNSTHCF